jgi:hypothetical protein
MRDRAATRFLLLFGITTIVMSVPSFAREKNPRAPEVGTIKGQVGVAKQDGPLVVPRLATVYILFSGEVGDDLYSHNKNFDAVGRDDMNPSGRMLAGDVHNINPPGGDSNTAGSQYWAGWSKNLKRDKELKRVEKDGKKNPSQENAYQIAKHMHQLTDQALQDVRDWIEKHSDRSWEMRTIATDEHGNFSVEGLPAGRYLVVVRGVIAGYDADWWEASVNLAPGKTLTLRFTGLRFICPESDGGPRDQ